MERPMTYREERQRQERASYEARIQEIEAFLASYRTQNIRQFETIRELNAQLEGMVPRAELEIAVSQRNTAMQELKGLVKAFADARAELVDLGEEGSGYVRRANWDNLKAQYDKVADRGHRLGEELLDARAEIVEVRQVLVGDNVLIASQGEKLLKAEAEIAKFKTQNASVRRVNARMAEMLFMPELDDE